MRGVHQVGNQVDRISVHCDPDSSISGTVIFPITEAQRNGLEDLRLVEFERDSGKSEWIGTHTAYRGRDIRPDMLRTRDFLDLPLTPTKGHASRSTGMSLFIRRYVSNFGI